MKIKNLIKKSAFVRSFKLDKRFFFVLLLDLFFILLLFSLVALYTFILRGNLDEMRPLDDSAKRIKDMMEGNLELTPQLEGDMDLVMSALKVFVSKMALVSILFLIMIIMAAGFIRGLVWCRILKEKLTKKIFFKFSILLFVWNLLWSLMLLIIVFGLRFRVDIIQKIAIAEFFLYIYFSLIICPIFFRTKNVFGAIKESFYLGASKFYLIIPSVLIMWLILMLLSFIRVMLSSLPSTLFLIIAFVLYLTYLVWIKFYINLVIEKIYT